MGLFDMFGRKPRTEGKKARKTREFKEESERLRKEALANKGKTKEKTRQDKAKAKTAVDRPMPKRPSAISLKNAAEQKAKPPMKPQVPPTSSVKPPKTDAAKTKNDMKAPPSGLANVTGKDKKPGLRRDVGTGSEEKANVTREQLQKTGLSLRDYLNFMDKNNRRPNKSDAAAAKKITAGFEAKKAKKMMGGGMAMKSKGYSKGGAMKTKGYKKGGKVRGAGIARKGVRPAKMR